jgi:uncharacterized membrane protein
MIMGLAGMVTSAVAAVAGAIMYFAVTAQSQAAVQNHGFSLSTMGVILMIAGAVGFVISTVVFATSRRAPSMPSQTMNREVVDSTGSRTIVHEERN